MIHKAVINIILSVFLLNACAEVSDSNESDPLDEEWLIPQNAVFDGGPGKDGIPALRNPNTIPVDQAGYLSGNDLVLIYRHGSEVRIYPHRILDWHEIINDDFDDFRLIVSYCPLTGSALGWEGAVKADGVRRETTFGVSGLLYNSNLILYDRFSDSYWSQMRIQCVAGRLKGQIPETFHLVETTFNTAKRMYPTAMVVSNQTGVYSADQYAIYPYGDYRTNDDRLIFPVSPEDNRLERKQRVLGVLGDTEEKAYTFDAFDNGISLIRDELDGESIIIAGSRSLNFMVAFRLSEDGGSLTYGAVQESLPLVMSDSEGNMYDIFGKVTAGPDEGMALKPAQSFIAFWFAWGAFYPGMDIYD